jgi:hypothetical protein
MFNLYSRVCVCVCVCVWSVQREPFSFISSLYGIGFFSAADLRGTGTSFNTIFLHTSFTSHPLRLVRSLLFLFTFF